MALADFFTTAPGTRPGTVFGEGPIGTRMMLVGEQPGDREDIHGHAFVGPAGRVPDRALAEAAIDRRSDLRRFFEPS